MGAIYYKGIETPNIESCKFGLGQIAGIPSAFLHTIEQSHSIANIPSLVQKIDYNSFNSCFMAVLCKDELDFPTVKKIVNQFPVLAIIVYHRLLALSPYKLIITGVDWNALATFINNMRASLDYKPGGEVPRIPITYYARTHYFVRELADNMIGSWAVLPSCKTIEELFQKSIPKNFIFGAFQTLSYIRPITEQLRFACYLYALRKQHEGSPGEFSRVNQKLKTSRLETLNQKTFEMLKKSDRLHQTVANIPVIAVGTIHSSICIVKAAFWLLGMRGEDYHLLWTQKWAYICSAFQKQRKLKNQKGVVDSETLFALGFKPIQTELHVPGLPFENLPVEKKPISRGQKEEKKGASILTTPFLSDNIPSDISSLLSTFIGALAIGLFKEK